MDWPRMRDGMPYPRMETVDVNTGERTQHDLTWQTIALLWRERPWPVTDPAAFARRIAAELDRAVGIAPEIPRT